MSSPRKFFLRKVASLAFDKNFLWFLKRSSIVGLLVGSFYRQAFTKSLKHGSHLSFLDNVGGLPFKIFRSTFMAGRLE